MSEDKNMVDPQLDGKVALVTGANHGIGAATAKSLAAQGASVFVSYLRASLEDFGITEAAAAEATTPGETLYRLNQAKTADEIVQTIRGNGGQADAWEADLADPDTIPRLFDRAEAALGPVEILVNNAAHCMPETFLPSSHVVEDPGEVGNLATVTSNGIDRHFAVNSRAPALLTAEYARRHIERGARWGRIINISTDGASAFPGNVSYGASKHALESYSRAAACELGPYGVTVNTLSLGMVQTGWISPELEEQGRRTYPLRQIGQPDDVANVVVFFASQQARWITGQLLYVGGGHVMPL